MTLKIMTFRFPDPCILSELPDLHRMVMDALRSKYRIPEYTPDHDLPPPFHPSNIESLYLEKSGAGWVANIGFANVPPGQPNTIGTIDAEPYSNALHAFLHGASVLCQLVTGSPELPFLVNGNELMVVSYGPGQAC